MTRHARIVSFGSAALVVLAGLASALFVGGLTGELLTMALVLGGLAGGVFLLFLEVGLSEEAERARERAERVHEQGSGGHSLARARLRRPRPGRRSR